MMRRGPGSLRRSAGAAVLALAVVGGCGTGDGQDVSDADPAATSSPDGLSSVDDFLAMLQGPGETVLGSHRVVLEISYDDGMPFGDLVERATVAADFRGESPAVDGTMELDDGSGEPAMHTVVVDGMVYANWPAMGPPGSSPGVEYVEVPLDEVDYLDPGMLSGDSPFTFVETLWDEWDLNAASVDLVGTEERDDLTLDHYVVTMEESSLGQDLDSYWSGYWPAAEAYDVWVDEDDLMRRVESTGGEASMVATVDLWGETLEIAAPDPSSVMSMEDFDAVMMSEEALAGGGGMPLEIMAFDEQMGVCDVGVGRLPPGEHMVLVVTDGQETVVEILDEDGEVVLSQVGESYREAYVQLDEGDYTVTCTYPEGFVGEDHLSVTAGE